MAHDICSALKKVEDGTFLKILMDHEHYGELIGPKLTSRFLEKNKQVIYITSNKPSSLLQNGLSKNNKESVYFIDMVSGSGSIMSKQEGNTHFMPSPNSLTEMGISIFVNPQFTKKKKLVVLDSLPSLIERNGKEEVINFLRFLRQRVDNSGDCGVLLSIVKDGNEEGFASEFCHEIVNLKKEVIE
jgi:hypothetical protein